MISLHIAVFDVPLTVAPLSFFTALGYENRVYDPRGELDPSKQYKRPYLNGVIPRLASIEAAGAIGAVDSERRSRARIAATSSSGTTGFVR